MRTNNIFVPYKPEGSAKATIFNRGGRTFSFIIQEAIDLVDGTVEDDNVEVVIGHIQDQILAHNGQTYEAEVTTGDDPRGSADIDAGQTGATVSPLVQSTRIKMHGQHCKRSRGKRNGVCPCCWVKTQPLLMREMERGRVRLELTLLFQPF